MVAEASVEKLQEKKLNVLGVDIDPEFLENWNSVMGEVNKDGAPAGTNTLLDMLDDESGYDNPMARAMASITLTSPVDQKFPFITPKHVDIQSLTGCYRDRVGAAKRLSELFNNRPKLTNDIAKGADFWLRSRFVGIGGESYSSYLQLARSVMPLVDKQMADKLINSYPIKCTFENFRYHQLIKSERTLLIHDTKVPFRFRNMAIKTWISEVKYRLEHQSRDISVEELLNESGLARFAENDATINQNHKNDAILARAIEFLEDSTPAEKSYILGANTLKVADHIRDPKLKFSFMYRHLFSSKSAVSPERRRIQSDTDLEQIKWVMENASNLVKPRQDWLNDEDMLHNIMYVSEGLIRDYQERIGQIRHDEIDRQQLLDTLK